MAFAFDTKRKVVLLVAGDKSGRSETRFYRELIRKADERFDAHLARVKVEEDEQKRATRIAPKKVSTEKGRK